MKEILHAKRMIFEGLIFITPPPGGPRPPRVENLNDEDRHSLTDNVGVDLNVSSSEI